MRLFQFLVSDNNEYVLNIQSDFADFASFSLGRCLEYAVKRKEENPSHNIEVEFRDRTPGSCNLGFRALLH